MGDDSGAVRGGLPLNCFPGERAKCKIDAVVQGYVAIFGIFSAFPGRKRGRDLKKKKLFGSISPHVIALVPR